MAVNFKRVSIFTFMVPFNCIGIDIYPKNTKAFRIGIYPDSDSSKILIGFLYGHEEKYTFIP
jgi:hypothetical protein